MKKVLYTIALASLFITGTAFKASHTSVTTKTVVASEWFDVRFENDCSNDVKLRIEADGSASEGTLNKHSTESHPLRKGYKVYVDGKLFLTASESDGGKTYVVCK